MAERLLACQKIMSRGITVSFWYLFMAYLTMLSAAQTIIKVKQSHYRP
jgi:hypothetical protein